MISQLFPLLLPLASWWDNFMGFLDTIMQPLYYAVSGILIGVHWLLSKVMDGNSGLAWALSIISLTITIRTLLIPLFVRQINSSRAMQMLGPKQKALQEKYGHDREKLGQETMKLFKEEGVSPYASCLPLLLQAPIFIGLYNVLSFASRGVALGFFKDNPDLLTGVQNATLFGAHLSSTFMPMNDGWGATQWLAGVLILLMTGTLFVTQLQLMRKNMPAEALTGQMAQQQKMMLYIFPFMYLFMGVNIPIGVLLYWFTSNLWTLGQQYILIHNNPAPNTPAYVDWADRMRAKGLDPEAESARRAGKGRRKTTVEQTSREVRVTRPDTNNGGTKGSGANGSDGTPPTGSRPVKPAGPKKPAAPSAAAADVPDSGRTQVTRQQPTRQARAKRKS